MHFNEKLIATAINKDDNHIKLGGLNCTNEENPLTSVTFIKFPDWMAIRLNIL